MDCRRFVIGSSPFLFFMMLGGCQDSGNTPKTDAQLEGQVLLISTPGPIPVGWVPPPYETTSTIVILNEARIVVKESVTDSKGKFSVSLSPGAYYVRVKESRVPAETGPFVLVAGETRTVEAHYDNGMR